jgi:hypothetical protein
VKKLGDRDVGEFGSRIGNVKAQKPKGQPHPKRSGMQATRVRARTWTTWDWNFHLGSQCCLESFLRSLLPLLLLWILPITVHAQFTYTATNGAITITGYDGSGGAVTIPSTIDGLPVSSIGNLAFYKRTNVTSVAIADGVANIGDWAFCVCTCLTNVTIGNSVTNIGDNAFSSCRSLISVNLPNSITRIGDYAFVYCTNLTSIAIPDSVTSIGGYAFDSCTGLTRVTVGTNVTSIGSYAFNSCTSLTNVTIPSGVANIMQGAFAYCTNLTRVTILGSVTSMGNYAFSRCFSLTGIHFQGSAPSLGGSSVFYNATNSTIYYLPGSTGWGATFGGRPTALWLPQVQTSDASFGVQTKQFGFNIDWASGMVVVVEARTNLANPIWYPVRTNTLTDGSSYFSDSQWTNYTRRFYRLRSP